MLNELPSPKSKKQFDYLTKQVDVMVFGGGAGSGKSLMGVLDFAQYINQPKFKAVMTRRTTPQIRGPGGLHDKCMEIFPLVDPKVRWMEKQGKFIFSSGAEIFLRHFENANNQEDFQGWELSKVLVDEGTQFEESMVVYLMSRLRNPACPIKPHIRITCNPDADSYLRSWVDWYLLPNGLPDPDKSGVIRWFIRQDNKMIWADTKEELIERFGERTKPLSFCFLPATVYDNPVLIEKQPEYLGWLEGLGRVEKERLLYGNWDVRQESSGYWKKEWCDTVEILPTNIISRVRAWDISGTLPSETNPNPDWTAGVLMAKSKDGHYYIEDVVRFRARHGEVQTKMLEVAKHDGADTLISIPCDPGAAGKAYAATIIREIADAGYYARMKQTNKSKISRFAPFAATSEAGNVHILRGEWNDDYIREMERFDGSRGIKDDQVDSTSDCFFWLSRTESLPYFQPPDLQTENPFKL